MVNSSEIDYLPQEVRWLTAIHDIGPLLETTALAALRGAGEAMPVSMAIVLANDATVREMNRLWRGEDKPTNVLSFATRDSKAPLPPEGPEPIGDVILAYETCVAEAEELGKPLAEHFRHLIVHGVLHLLGYDHQGADEAVEMETLETTILKGLDVPDPYAGTELL